MRSILVSSIALLFVCSCIYNPLSVGAQVAPTNSATITGSLSDSAGKAVAGAKVSLTGPRSKTTQTDAHGLFVFVGLPFGTYLIAASSPRLGIATRAGISVQGDTNIAIQYEPPNTNGMKVIANVSSNANATFNVTPASITQVNPMTNAFNGATSWRKILEQIPGVIQAGLGNGRGGFAASPDSPMEPVQLSINGALPYETAILIDNMPLIGGSHVNSFASTGGGTNLGLYPLNGFGSADVVRGPGASAPSIVDSVGGSFVLHAPGIVNKNNYEISVSTDPYGGVVANALAQVRMNRLSLVATYGINDSPGPMNSPEVPASIVNLEIGSASVNGFSLSCTVANNCASQCLKDPHYAAASSPYDTFQSGLLFCCEQISTAWSQHSGSIGLHYQVSSAVNADLFYAGQTSQESIPYGYTQTNFVAPGGYTGAISSGVQFLTQDSLLAPLPEVTTSSLLEEKITARLANGMLRLAALQNRVFTNYSVYSPASGTYQLFGGGSVCSNTSANCSTGTYSPTVFNGDSYNIIFGRAYNLIDVSSSDNRDLLVAYDTPLNNSLQVGASWVRSYYDINYYEASGSLTFFFGGGPGNSQTTNEMRVFLNATPTEKTSFDLSGYFVNASYNVPNPLGFSTLTGSSPNGRLNPSYTYAAPRLGFVWRPTAALALRAAAGGGFAEAPLTYLIGSSGAAPNCSSGVYCTQTLTNVNLQPEKSFGFDVGTDIRLPNDTVLSFDLYHTNLFGQLYSGTQETGTYLGLPLLTTQYYNLAESRMEGILIDIRHDIPHGLYWMLSGGLTRGYVVSVPLSFYNPPGSTCNFSTGANCVNLNLVPGANFTGNPATGGVSVPYAQGLGTLGYRWSPEKYLDLVGTYFGSNNTYFRPAFLELDGHVGYPLSKKVALLVTFRNITGVYDNALQTYSPANVISAPVVAGLPYAEFGEEYGPRTVLLTTRFHF